MAVSHVELLYEALREPIGIVVETDNRDLLRQRLYRDRLADPDLAVLAFVFSPFNTTDLWIIKKEIQRG